MAAPQDKKSDIGVKAPSPYENCNCQCHHYTWQDTYGKIQGNCKSSDGTRGPTGPGPTSEASSAASSAAAATGRSTSPEWETSPRRRPPPPRRPRAESISDSDRMPFSVIHGLIAQVCTLI